MLALLSPSQADLTLYALMALVNLSYSNASVQTVICICGGLPLILQQLSSSAYEVSQGRRMNTNPALIQANEPHSSS